MNAAVIPLFDLPPVPKPTPAAGFDEFWLIWPNKKAKKAARPVYARVMKSGAITQERLLSEVRRYIDSKEEWKPYMLPTTFLNGDRWEDEYEVPDDTGKTGAEIMVEIEENND